MFRSADRDQQLAKLGLRRGTAQGNNPNSDRHLRKHKSQSQLRLGSGSLDYGSLCSIFSGKISGSWIGNRQQTNSEPKDNLKCRTPKMNLLFEESPRNRMIRGDAEHVVGADTPGKASSTFEDKHYSVGFASRCTAPARSSTTSFCTPQVRSNDRRWLIPCQGRAPAASSVTPATLSHREVA